MAMDNNSTQLLDILFDEDGVLTKEFDMDSKNHTVQTLSFNDLLSGEILDMLPMDAPVDTGMDNVFDDLSTKQTLKKDVHTHSDHDYLAHNSPRHNSDSGTSLNSMSRNSLEMDDSFLSSVSPSSENSGNYGDRALDTSPHQSDSMSPLSDTNSESNPIGLEDFDFSTFMDFGQMDSEDGDGTALETQDTAVSIDFDVVKGEPSSMPSTINQQHVQTIKTANGQQAVILVDANTRQPIQFSLSPRSASSKTSSLPFTTKDLDCDFSTISDSGKFPELRLTDEEKELLAKEGMDLPTNMPLTKEEERVLKAVRRKIRNKISAKESRKRKQGYMDGLERRVKICTQENQHLIKKVNNLEKENKSLFEQLKQLKAKVSGTSRGHVQTSTCVMVLLLSFALLVIPNISPFGSDSPAMPDAVVRGHSRSLLGKEEVKAEKVSMFTEKETQDDVDPYGITRKPGMPWEAQSPKKDAVPSTPFTREDDDLIRTSNVNKIDLQTNESESVKGEHAPEAAKHDLLFESEVKEDSGSPGHPPPAKKARQEVRLEDDDL